MVGIDIGSRYVKIASFDGNGGYELTRYDSAEFYRKYGVSTQSGFAIDMKSLKIPDDAEIVSTGYGRERASLSGAKEIPEIQAHAAGSSYLLNISDFTLIDFGGQDTKVIKVESKSTVDFLTSDRCAASTGRFLENMAKVLGLTLDELAQYYENPIKISSTCAVFAETEILEKISRGIPIEQIAAGVNRSVVERFARLVMRFPSNTIVASGGVASSKAVIKLLSDELGISVIVPQNPQFAGAIGCLVYK